MLPSLTPAVSYNERMHHWLRRDGRAGSRRAGRQEAGRAEDGRAGRLVHGNLHSAAGHHAPRAERLVVSQQLPVGLHGGARFTSVRAPMSADAPDALGRKTGQSSTKIWPQISQVRPNLARSRPQFGPTSAKLGPSSAKPGLTSAWKSTEFGPKSAKFGQLPPGIDRSCPNSAKVGHSSANVGPGSPNIERRCTKHARSRPKLIRS